MNLAAVKYIDRYGGILLCHLMSALHLFREMIWPVESTVVPRRILLVKLWGLGNIVMMLPVIRAVRRCYPDARIEFLTLLGNRPLLELETDLDRIHYLDDGSAFGLATSSLRALSGLRRPRVDLMIDFEQFARASALFGFFIGARQRIGLNTPGQGRGHVYTAQVPYDDHQHMSETFLDLARAGGVEEEKYVPHPPRVSAEDRAVVDRWLTARGIADRPLVVMHPGSGDNFPGRRWPSASFGRLADDLGGRFGAVVVVTGSPGERSVTTEVVHASRDTAIDAAGAFTIRQLIALIDRARLLCSNDTAPVHLAAALGRSVIGFYGPNTPRLYGPAGTGDHALFYKGLPCSPCITNFNYKTSFCRMPVCITNIRVCEVARAAARLLERAELSARREAV